VEESAASASSPVISALLLWSVVASVTEVSSTSTFTIAESKTRAITVVPAAIAFPSSPLALRYLLHLLLLLLKLLLLLLELLLLLLLQLQFLLTLLLI
jgi:hypothetical protein